MQRFLLAAYKVAFPLAEWSHLHMLVHSSPLYLQLLTWKVEVFLFFLFLAMLITLPWHWLDLLWNNYLRHALGCFDTFLIKLFKWPRGGRSWMPSDLSLVLWAPSQLALCSLSFILWTSHS
jgi:hypothetical protein